MCHDRKTVPAPPVTDAQLIADRKRTRVKRTMIGNCKVEAIADKSTGVVHFVVEGPVAELHRLAETLKGAGYKVETDENEPNTLYVQGTI